MKAFIIDNQNNDILEEQKLTNKQNDNHVTAAASKCVYKFS